MLFTVSIKILFSDDEIAIAAVTLNPESRRYKDIAHLALADWCNENSGDRWGKFGTSFWFNQPEEGVAFRLRWHGATIEME